MSHTLESVNALAQEKSQKLRMLLAESSKVIVGQEAVLERLLIALLTGGHILMEGVPGLAKTLMVKTFSQLLDVSYKRIQFTPDLLPADVVGTMIFDPSRQVFEPKKGPVFASVVLADEINRAPAKVQSALLEAMQERQVTIGDQSYPLPQPFIVLATQNPIEQEGTYPLPEAQVDRFMMKVLVSYPSKEDERVIIDRMTTAGPPTTLSPVMSSNDMFELQRAVSHVYVDDKIKDYVISIVHATREPSTYQLSQLTSLIECGASPRASINVILAAKAYAFIRGRGFVTPDDVKAITHDVLRHRIMTSFEADAAEMSADDLLDRIFAEITVP